MSRPASERTRLVESVRRVIRTFPPELRAERLRPGRLRRIGPVIGIERITQHCVVRKQGGNTRQ